tara:strand:+ start:3897 stop:4241 length:345 start_codon:yes stop_codon:yes gene_type:complete
MNDNVIKFNTPTRKNDPKTSRNKWTNTKDFAILYALTKSLNTGGTFSEIAKYTGIKEVSISSRLKAFRDKGWVYIKFDEHGNPDKRKSITSNCYNTIHFLSPTGLELVRKKEHE